ncbi:MAG: alpha-amylase family glycosyl hydrolase, partial [Bacteroidota bacterium]
MKKRVLLLFVSILLIFSESCNNGTSPVVDPPDAAVKTPFLWEAANVYFMLTDRFHNGDPGNDVNFDRTKETAVLRGFKGGDLKGITQKLEEGYFEDLGVNAIWFTPFFEQVRGGTNEGTGYTYAFHGYWPRDFTTLDPNFGTYDDLKKLVDTAHRKGIRVVMDVIVNHIGPVTPKDPVWPDEWVREDPTCQFQSYETTVTCTLVDNLPDIKTEVQKPVELPPFLVEKWKAEGRYDAEVAELDAFFERTGYPRAAKYYVIKWLADYVKELGIDGYRLDTAKHVEEEVSIGDYVLSGGELPALVMVDAIGRL